jgi:tetratricopeptide (TPR) repeat protein
VDYLNKENWDAVIAESAEALKLNVNDACNALAYAYIGTGYVGKEDWDKAITTSTKAIGLDPKGQAGYMGYLYRGIAYSQKEDLRVIDDWEAALKIIDDPSLKEQLALLKQVAGM